MHDCEHFLTLKVCFFRIRNFIHTILSCSATLYKPSVLNNHLSVGLGNSNREKKLREKLINSLSKSKNIEFFWLLLCSVVSRWFLLGNSITYPNSKEGSHINEQPILQWWVGKGKWQWVVPTVGS